MLMVAVIFVKLPDSGVKILKNDIMIFATTP
jgi:hypothetical protein